MLARGAFFQRPTGGRVTPPSPFPIVSACPPGFVQKCPKPGGHDAPCHCVPGPHGVQHGLGQPDVAKAVVTAGVAVGIAAAAFLLGIFVGANIATLWPGEAACNRCDEMK